MIDKKDYHTDNRTFKEENQRKGTGQTQYNLRKYS